MRHAPLSLLRSAWPLWVPTLAFLLGLATGGLADGVIGWTLTFLVVGPLYLVRQWWLHRTGRIPPPAPLTPARQALLIRLWVVVNAVLGIGFVIGAFERGDRLPGRGWTALLVVVAVCGVGALPYLWATAADLETGRTSRRGWAVAAAADLLVAVGLLGFAAVNLWTAWLSWPWTVALAVVGAVWVVMALGCVARLRARS